MVSEANIISTLIIIASISLAGAISLAVILIRANHRIDLLKVRLSLVLPDYPNNDPLIGALRREVKAFQEENTKLKEQLFKKLHPTSELDILYPSLL